MRFTEKVKLKVKKMAMFKCCRCETPSVDVHHIVPQEDGGSNDISNAAPLCQNCHSLIGANRDKQKEVRQMRDNWYEVVKKKYAPIDSGFLSLIENTNETLDLILAGQNKTGSTIEDLKTNLKELSDRSIDKMTLGTATLTASNVITSSMASISSLEVHPATLVNCWECGNAVFITGGENACPHCGSSLEQLIDMLP